MTRTLAYRVVLTILRTLVRPRHRVHYRVTVLKLDRLGDAVLSLGAVRALASVFGEDQLLLIISDAAVPLFRREFPAAELLVMPAFSYKFWPDYLMSMVRQAKTLRAISTDDLICLRHQHSDYLYSIASLIHAGRCHASSWHGSREHVCLTLPRWSPTPYPRRHEAQCLELEAHRRLISQLTGRKTCKDVIPALLNVTATDGNCLLVCPVAGDQIRHYPSDQLVEALRLFQQAANSTPIRFCLPPHCDSTPWRSALATGGIVVDQWVFPSDALALAEAIAESRMVFALESAPAHLAAALDKPGVFLLGGGHYGMFAPWQRSERQRWLSEFMDCYECQWNCCQRESLCITRIKPGTIADALLALEKDPPANEEIRKSLSRSGVSNEATISSADPSQDLPR